MPVLSQILAALAGLVLSLAPSLAGPGLRFLGVSTGDEHALEEKTRRVEETLDAMAALGRWNGTALVAHEGRILVHRGYGLADFENGVANTTETRFRIASISKAFAAVAALLLERQGKLDLARPISEILPGCPPAWSAITSEHLIHHTSGLSDYEEWFGGYGTPPYSDFMASSDPARRILERAKEKPLDFTPGTRFHYSNTGYIVLGFVLEAAAGESFEDFCAREIFQRLGMDATSQDRSELLVPHRARGVVRAPEVGLAQWYRGMRPEHLRNAHAQHMQPPQPEAGVLTTAADLYRWSEALSQDGFLSAAERARVFAPGLEGYGFGWFVSDEPPHGIVQQHSGGLPGFACQLVRLPDTRSTIVLLGNQGMLDTKLVADLVRILAGERTSLPRARAIVSRPPEELERFAGRYDVSDGTALSVERDGGGLFLTWGPRRVLAFPEADDTFFLVFLPERDEGLLRFREEDGLLLATIEDAFGELLAEAAHR